MPPLKISWSASSRNTTAPLDRPTKSRPGFFRRGAAGFWVERGEIQYPVAEITIAGNLRTMLKGIAAVGDDVDVRGGTRMGSLLLDEMTIAGE